MLQKQVVRRVVLAFFTLLAGTVSASADDCERRCLSRYQASTYANDQRACRQENNVSRCIEERIAYAQNLCGSACESAYGGLESPEYPSIQIDGSKLPKNDSVRIPQPGGRRN